LIPRCVEGRLRQVVRNSCHIRRMTDGAFI
jgi:hypothetical protein